MNTKRIALLGLLAIIAGGLLWIGQGPRGETHWERDPANTGTGNPAHERIEEATLEKATDMSAEVRDVLTASVQSVPPVQGSDQDPAPKPVMRLLGKLVDATQGWPIPNMEVEWVREQEIRGEDIRIQGQSGADGRFELSIPHDEDTDSPWLEESQLVIRGVHLDGEVALEFPRGWFTGERGEVQEIPVPATVVLKGRIQPPKVEPQYANPMDWTTAVLGPKVGQGSMEGAVQARVNAQGQFSFRIPAAQCPRETQLFLGHMDAEAQVLSVRVKSMATDLGTQVLGKGRILRGVVRSPFPKAFRTKRVGVMDAFRDADMRKSHLPGNYKMSARGPVFRFRTAPVAEDGTFAFHGMRAGTYQVSLQPPGNGDFLLSQASQRAFAQEVVLHPGVDVGPASPVALPVELEEWWGLTAIEMEFPREAKPPQSFQVNTKHAGQQFRPGGYLQVPSASTDGGNFVPVEPGQAFRLEIRSDSDLEADELQIPALSAGQMQTLRLRFRNSDIERHAIRFALHDPDGQPLDAALRVSPAWYWKNAAGQWEWASQSFGREGHIVRVGNLREGDYIFEWQRRSTDDGRSSWATAIVPVTVDASLHGNVDVHFERGGKLEVSTLVADTGAPAQQTWICRLLKPNGTVIAQKLLRTADQEYYHFQNRFEDYVGRRSALFSRNELVPAGPCMVRLICYANQKIQVDTPVTIHEGELTQLEISVPVVTSVDD